jgi:hypothetical protein
MGDSLQQVVESLVADVDAAWRQKDFRREALPDVATSSLAQAALHTRLDVATVLSQTLALLTQPHARGYHQSSTCVSLYQGRRFAITLHVWTDRIETPHAHGWRGGFQVLSGPVVHSIYRFEREEALSAGISRGTLVHERLDLMGPGDVASVRDPRMIHGLCHIQAPSLSLAIRSVENTGVTGQYWGLGADTLEVDVESNGFEAVDDILICLGALALVDREAYRRELVSVVDRVGIGDAFWICRALGSRSLEARNLVLDAMQGERWQAWGTVIRKALRWIEAETRLNAAFRRVRDTRERYLLALLRLAADGRQVLGVMQSLDGARRDGIQCTLEALERIVGAAGSALTLSPINESMADILRALLEEPTLAHVRAHLAAEYDEDSIAASGSKLDAVVSRLQHAPELLVFFGANR